MVGDADSGVVAVTNPPGWWDFMLRVPMNGQFGLSGRIYEWSQPIRARTAANVELYKRIRGTIAGADVYHLTPPPHRTHPTGWMAIQYVAPGARRSVVLAYRLAKGRAEETFRLRGLVPDAEYEVSEGGRRLLRASGAELAARGLRVTRAAEWRAAVVEVNCTAQC
jgi:hypothetical protein